MPSANIQTPLGSFEVRASVSGDPASIERISLLTVVPQEILPEGMSVAQIEAVILIVRPGRQLHELVFECIWTTPRCDGVPEPGEGLDAQSWEHGGNIVMVGTEDFERLHSRLPLIALRSELSAITFLPSSLQVSIPTVEPDQTLSLHFVIACNHLPEPVECSAWYAVDIRHEHLLQAIRA